MAVQARAEKTRSAVLRAGAVVFNREGFAGATTAAIIREAAVTRGAMQFHFRTKEKLAQAVIAEYRQSGWQQHDCCDGSLGGDCSAAY
jgi:AcrR family transcriptional regulator